ncbi:hypothetical protein EN852_036640 [Mesorhizobium sp. M2E.F.Ca.ET.209.01.1.1]|nr:hypothetical protein EN852_036640 [Mesorhizobium sp. M2E.F.Ca.ET.209.01.1.1]
MSGTERMRRHRQRLRQGRMPLVVDVPEVELTEFLARVGYLNCQTEDRAALRKATERWIADATSAAAYELVTASRSALLRHAIGDS